MTAAKGIRAGRAFVELSADNRKLTEALKSAEGALHHFGRQVQGVGLAAAAASAAVLTPMIAMTKNFATAGDELDKLSSRVGDSAENLSKLQYAARMTGVDVGLLESGIRGMQRNLELAKDGSGAAADALRQLGLNAADLQRQAPTAALKAVAEQLRQVENGNTRAALAMQIFGRSGAELIPLLNEGAAGLDTFFERAERLGVVMSQETAAAAARLNDAFSDLSMVLRHSGLVIGSSLAPELEQLTRQLVEVVSNVQSWLAANKSAIIGTAKLAAYVGAAGVAMAATSKTIIGLITVIDKIIKVKQSWAKTQATLLALMGPKGWVALAGGITAAAGAVYALDKAFQKMSEGIDPDVEKGIDGIAAAAQGAESAVLKLNGAMRTFEGTSLSALGREADELGLDEFEKVKLQMQKDDSWDSQAEELLELYKRVITEKREALALEDDAAAIIERNKTAQERYNEEVEKLNTLRSRGLLNEEQYTREISRQRDALSESLRDPQAESLQRLADSIYDRTRTPMEQYKKEVEKLNKLVEQGLLDEDTHARAIDKAREAMEKKTGFDIDFPDMINEIKNQATGAFSGFGRFDAQGGAAVDRTANATEQMSKDLRDMLNLQRASEEVVV